MTHRTVLLGLGVAAALTAGVARGDDPMSRALLERAQQSDAFSLRLQQSLERARAGELGPRKQLELDARQRGQRQRQDERFDQQQIQTYSPSNTTLRHAEAMRAEQERQQQLSRFRFDAASSVRRESPALRPAPIANPTLVTAPIPRTPVDPARMAPMPNVNPARAESLAMIRHVEDKSDTLWQAALAGNWNAVQGALGDVRGSVNALRSDRFKKKYAESGGRMDALAEVLDRLDAALAGTEIQLGTRDATSVMRSANTLMLTAAELVPDLVAARTRRSFGQRASGRP